LSQQPSNIKLWSDNWSLDVFFTNYIIGHKPTIQQIRLSVKTCLPTM